MIRNLFVPLLIVSLTLVSVYFGAHKPLSAAAASQDPVTEAPAAIALKSITVPVIANGALQGYVLVQITVSAKSGLLKSLPQPPNLFLTDEAFKTVYEEEQVDFKHLEKQNLAGLSKKITGNINARAGVPVAEDVFIQELHYFSKQDMKHGSLFRH